jgi:DNA topoisomerase-1
MMNAVMEQKSVDITGGNGTFRITSTRVKFDGFLKVYKNEKKQNEEEGTTKKIPKLEVGDDVILKELMPKQHFTEPPPRFTDASLVKRLEESGIGRPSTYAPTIATILKRYYVTREKRQLAPTFLGNIVNDIVSQCFPNIVNEKFTAKMEQKLDNVEEEKTDWHDIVKDFYPGFVSTIEEAHEKVQSFKDALDEETDIVCEKCDRPMVKRLGKFGYFLACTGFPECRNSKPLPLGKCPKKDCDGDVVMKRGKRGKGRAFYACTNYPDCDFITYYKPIEKPCPKCGMALFSKKEKGKGYLNICLNEDCGYSEEAE